MNKSADVVFAYSPKNDDELELNIGDKIEVIGFVEEGWWKGKLNGRIGVFPSNFVKFKPTKFPPGSSGGIATERLSTMNANNLLKQVPKKPPPPTPIDDTNNGNMAQAPALPPKPANQFSPHLQHQRLLPALHQPPTLKQQQQQHQSLPQPPSSHQSVQKREQARVLYAYEPANDDELALEAGDIINVLDKHIEDAGWWKGEHRGKIGVFPDNFVQLIESPETINQEHSSTNRSSTISQPPLPQATNQPHNSESAKFKSVFATTPKGFNKELESNLEKHNNAASFLSLKRNKLQQQQQQMPSSTGEVTTNEDTKTRNDGIDASTNSNSPSKLNHITANRAKGPTRRPPTNFLGKRNEIDNMNKQIETNGCEESPPKVLHSNSTTPSATSLIAAAINANSITTPQHQQTPNHDSLTSLPSATSHQTMSVIGSFPPRSIESGLPITNSIKPSMSLDNVIDESNQAPKTSQRSNKVSVAQDKTTTSETPAWMVELKKARKRETPLGSGSSAQEDDNSPSKVNGPLPNNNRFVESTNNVPTLPVESSVSNQQISKNVTSELNELREELKRMQLDIQGMKELKETVEVMKSELRACQSATENQKRYIKDLVNNLADERKKIAAMQTELERNLK